jgi:hypothetical protein
MQLSSESESRAAEDTARGRTKRLFLLLHRARGILSTSSLCVVRCDEIMLVGEWMERSGAPGCLCSAPSTALTGGQQQCLSARASVCVFYMHVSAVCLSLIKWHGRNERANDLRPPTALSRFILDKFGLIARRPAAPTF